jgi:hypothetical protein
MEKVITYENLEKAVKELMQRGIDYRKKISAEIEGATEACKVCDNEKKPICYVLKTLKQLGLFYKGKCGRDTATGIIITRGDVNGE